jgi:hypothetical protein
MAEDRMAVLDTVRKAIADEDPDFWREGARVLAQAVMEAEVTGLTGLPHGERDPERRLTRHNGYRDRRWDTRVGTVDLAIRRVRDGSPSHPCSNRGVAPSAPCSRSSRRRTCSGSARGVSTTSSGRWTSRASASRGVPRRGRIRLDLSAPGDRCSPRSGGATLSLRAPGAGPRHRARRRQGVRARAAPGHSRRGP